MSNDTWMKNSFLLLISMSLIPTCISAQTTECYQYYTLENNTFPDDVIITVSDTMISSAIHTHNSMAYYSAGQSILMNQGFEIEEGSTYCADIEDCNNCNGVVDTCGVCNGSGPSTWCEDLDSDGMGNSAVTMVSCDQPLGYANDCSNAEFVCSGGSTPLSAFDDFNSEAVTISFAGNEVTLESNGLPNHTSPYWENSHPLHIDAIVADHLTPGSIREENYTVTLPRRPAIATASSATGLGPIGIAVTGVPIFNDEERANEPLDINTAGGFDYAGGHRGPGGYHYHVESADVSENTTLSHNDEQLIGIMSDGFLLYGRKCNSTGNHPSDLDASGGHSSETQHCNSEPFYHYHIINEFYIGSYIVLFGADLKGTPNGIL